MLLLTACVDVVVCVDLGLGQPWSFECWRTETDDYSGLRDGFLLAWLLFGMPAKTNYCYGSFLVNGALMYS